MNKTKVPLLGFLLLYFSILSCDKGTSQLEWSRHYNEPIIYQWQTTMGDAKLSIATPKSWNRQTWFYFHGAGGHLESFKDFAQLILKYRRVDTFPNIIGISLGPKWFLVDHESDDTVKGSTLFWGTFVPTIKKSVKDLGKKISLGHSMGGFNALSLFADHPEYWDSIVLLTPAIADLSPYASKKEIQNYLARTCAATWKQSLKRILLNSDTPTDKIDIILGNWRRLAKDDREWNRINPLYRLERLNKATRTKIFISCGRQDPFGFIEGATIAMKSLHMAGFAVESHFVPGGHMTIPYNDVYQFLEAL